MLQRADAAMEHEIIRVACSKPPRGRIVHGRGAGRAQGTLGRETLDGRIKTSKENTENRRRGRECLRAPSVA